MNRSGRPARGCRPTRPFFAPVIGRCHGAALFAIIPALLSAVTIPASARATPLCSDDTTGWCVARRISGDFPGGELGFRFGEPLDMDGDGRADIAAGARYRLQRGTLQNGDASVWSGATGARIRKWEGTHDDGLFGHWVLPVADLTNDTVADVVISAPNARVDGTVRGVLVARSPKTGEQIWERVGSRTENLGWDLAIADDHDNDGRNDLFVGSPSTKGGRVYLLSARDGTLLHTYAPPKETPSFGWYVAGLDDLDGDGHADLVAGAHTHRDAEAQMVGNARVFSSATGKQLLSWDGADHLSGFGEVVAALADLDGDNRGEVVVAAPRTNDQTRTRAGDVYVYSGSTGKQLRHWSGSQPGELFGRMVVSAGDIDGDNIEDVVIGAPWHRRQQGDKSGERTGEKTGRVELRSGRTGDVLAEWFGDEAGCWFGWHIRRAPDPDGLGRPTLLVGSLRHPVDGHAEVGVLDLYVLRRESDKPVQGTITRGERRSDIK